MKVIACVSMKGGSGKSTTAVHIAVCGQNAGISSAIIDTDPQGSAYRWFTRRTGETPGVIREADPEMLPMLAQRAAANGVQLLVIDTPPKLETMALAACEGSDLIITPVRPTQVDLETLGSVQRMIRLAERSDRCFVMLTQCPSTSPRVIENGEQFVKDCGMKLLPHRFHARSHFAHALAVGQAAHEYDVRLKAADEAIALFEWTRQQLALEA